MIRRLRIWLRKRGVAKFKAQNASWRNVANAKLERMLYGDNIAY